MADEPVNKKLIFDDLSSPVKRHSFIASPKQPIRLYCRVRPQLPDEVSRQETPCLHVADAQTLVSVAPEESFAYKSTKRGLAHRSHEFNFTKVFGPQSSQQEVFSDAVTHILKDFLEGQNSLLFSYGVTNSGKTHTICGCDEDPGILPRVLDSVFVSLGDQLYCGDELKPKNFSEVERLSGAEKRREQEATACLLARAHSMNSSMSSNHSSVHTTRSNLTISSYNSSHSAVMEGTVLSGTECSESQPHCEAPAFYEPSVLEVDVQSKAVGVWVSCVEIYNEFIYDLFAEISTKRATRQKGKGSHPQRHTLRLAEDKNHNVFIKGLTEVQVTSVEDAKLLAQYGQHNRHVGTTLLNQASSRSHCIFTVKLIRLMDTDRPRQAIINRMSIVDLAGSERSRKTKGSGQVVKEAGSINVSLHILGKCITALRQNQKRDKTCIPFRESKLTQVFQNYFVGKGCGTREGRVTMFVNVSPSPAVFGESLKVLEVSAIASKVVPYVQPLPRGVKGGSVTVSIENAESTPVHEVILRQHSDEAMTGQATGEGISDLSPEVVLDDQATPCVVFPERGGVMAFITPAPANTLQPVCPKCEHYQSLVKKWKDEIVELKLKLWEQESQIRSEVCREFQEQVAEIKEEHKEMMMEQVDHLEEMHEQRMELLTQSIRKVVRSKKRRREEEGEEADTAMEDLQKQVKELEKTVASKDEELEQVKLTMKHLRKEYESSMVEQNGCNNDLAVRASSLEKKLACLEDENSGLMKEKDANALLMQRLEKHNTELLQQLKLLEAEKKEAECFAKESTLVMEEQLRGYQAQLTQARQEAQEATEQQEWKDKLKQVQLELDKMAAEKKVLGDEVASLTHSLEELRAQSAKREAEWAESKEVVRGALEGQVAEMQRQLSAVQDELSDARQAVKEKEEELTQLYKKGISSEQFAVMEQKLEESWATEKALRAEVKMWKTELQELKVSSEKEVARLQAHNELEVGELNVQLRELSHQLQQANSSGSTHAPLLPTLTAQPSGAVTKGKPIAKRTRKKRGAAKHNTSISSDSGSAASTHSASDDREVPANATTDVTSAVCSVPTCVVRTRGSPTLPPPRHEDHIYDEPYTDCEKVEDSTHTHLPNIETSSQLLEPDQSLTNREEIDVTYAKLSKAQRKRRPPVAGPGPATHSSIPVKCKRVELEEVFPMDDALSPSKRAKPPPAMIAVSSKSSWKQTHSKTEEAAEDENDSTPKTMSSLRKKLGKVMSKSAGKKGKKLTDSTNLGEGEARFESPLQAVPSPRLSRTAGRKKRITKSQISGPLDLITSPAADVRANQPKAAISWDLRRKGKINYAVS